MKFIKDADGVYVNIEKATAFYVVRKNTPYGVLILAEACLFIGELKFTLKRFGTVDEAQTYLDELVAKLNAEETHHVED